jgi:hypothetical protein
MRQKYKDLEFYDRFVKELDFLERRSHDWIKEGKIPLERMNTALDLFRAGSLTKTILKYTFGESVNEIIKEFKNVIKYTNENWVGLWTLKLSAEKTLKQYTLSGYDEMSSMLSLGYLLDITDEDFKKLVDVIDRDGVKDFLFEFIIRAKLKDREPIIEESYQKYYHIPNCFEKLRQAITETDKSKAEKLVKEFITKDWYKNHKGQGWHDCHKGKHDTYFGYWSFETAAVVKIMSLDDSSFKDCQYYPKDLVHLENH